MRHLIILIYGTCLVLGISAVVFTRQKYALLKDRALIAYFRYLVLFNILILGNLASDYILFNVLKNPPVKTMMLVEILQVPLAILLVFGISWALLTAGLGVLGRRVGRFLGFLVRAVPLALSLGYGVALWEYLDRGRLGVFRIFRPAVDLSFLAVCAAIGLSVWLAARSLPEPNRRLMALEFGGLHALGFAGLAATLALPSTWVVMGVAGVYLLMNAIPFVWLRHFPLSHLWANGGTGMAPAVAGIYEKHQLTAREQEIVALLLQGKTNREIAGSLFIAESTVKNHIYRIFQKLEIKSRSQLARLVLDALAAP